MLEERGTLMTWTLGGREMPGPLGKRQLRLGLVPALVVATLAGAAIVAQAQIDPEPRANLEVGVERGLRGGDSPFAGYGFFLWNKPHLLEDPNLYLRVVAAPVYLRSELIRDNWPAPGHALGIGINGGMFPDNFDEFRGGDYKRSESFWGHGGEATFSYYLRRFKIADILPVEGQVRFRPQYVVYQESGSTDARFVLPEDTPIYTGRVGLRVGGVPPEVLPDVALEFSLWHETSYRQNAGSYGLPERPVETNRVTHNTWGLLGGILTLARTHTASAFLTAGTTAGVDALSAFRLGTALRLRDEFPLVLHGYFTDEVFARAALLLNLSYRFPVLPGSDRVRLQLNADYARVDYLPGHELPRKGLRGVGADLAFDVTDSVTLILGYGYGVDAPRNGGFGGHEASLLLEVRFQGSSTTKRPAQAGSSFAMQSDLSPQGADRRTP
jgi:hypothetical protein